MTHCDDNCDKNRQPRKFVSMAEKRRFEANQRAIEKAKEEGYKGPKNVAKPTNLPPPPPNSDDKKKNKDPRTNMTWDEWLESLERVWPV